MARTSQGGGAVTKITYSSTYDFHGYTVYSDVQIDGVAMDVQGQGTYNTFHFTCLIEDPFGNSEKGLYPFDSNDEYVMEWDEPSVVMGWYFKTNSWERGGARYDSVTFVPENIIEILQSGEYQLSQR